MLNAAELARSHSNAQDLFDWFILALVDYLEEMHSASSGWQVRNALDGKCMSIWRPPETGEDNEPEAA